MPSAIIYLLVGLSIAHLAAIIAMAREMFFGRRFHTQQRKDTLIIHIKLHKLMSQVDDLNAVVAKLGTDIAGIAGDVAGIGQEIADLKAQLASGAPDISGAIATLTTLEGQAAAAKTALDALVPPAAPAPATT